MHKVTVITKKTEVITLKTGPRGPQGIKGDKGDKGDQGDVNLTQLNTKVDKLFATNLITNGDFSNGTTGWVDISNTVSVIDGRLVINTSAGIAVQQMLNIINANKYYTAFKVKSDGIASVVISFRNGVTNVSPLIPTNIALNNFQIQSQIITATNVGDRLNIARNSTTSNIVELDDFIIINLTSLFGAGNEPTKEQMDYLLSVYPNSWFNGTQELINYKQLLDYVIDLDNAKANKTQEAWITPTLLNGWVNNAGNTSRYKKDAMGVVWVELFVNAGTTSSVIFQLPVGYRPTQSLFITGNASGATAQIILAPGGNINHSAGANTSLHRYVFSFRTD